MVDGSQYGKKLTAFYSASQIQYDPSGKRCLQLHGRLLLPLIKHHKNPPRFVVGINIKTALNNKAPFF